MLPLATLCPSVALFAPLSLVCCLDFRFGVPEAGASDIEHGLWRRAAEEYDFRREDITQSTKQLSFLSRPPGSTLPRRATYVQLKNPGQGAYVYLLDTVRDVYLHP